MIIDQLSNIIYDQSSKIIDDQLSNVIDDQLTNIIDDEELMFPDNGFPQKTCWVVFDNASLLNWCSKTKSVLCQFYQMISLASLSNDVSGTFTKPNQTMLQEENSPVLRYCCTSDPVRLVGPFHSPDESGGRNKQKQHIAIEEYRHNKRDKKIMWQLIFEDHETGRGEYQDHL